MQTTTENEFETEEPTAVLDRAKDSREEQAWAELGRRRRQARSTMVPG